MGVVTTVEGRLTVSVGVIEPFAGGERLVDDLSLHQGFGEVVEVGVCRGERAADRPHRRDHLPVVVAAEERGAA